MMAYAFLMPFLYIIGLTVFLIYTSNKKHSFATALPLALISTTLFVFLFTCIFHNISIGFWITVAISVSSIILIIRDKNRLDFIKKRLLTPGFITFCLIYIFVFIINYNKIVPILSDTTMHWAPHVLTMWLNNDFYTSPVINTVIHGDYPPAAQLFELIWTKTTGVYSEDMLYVAIQVLSFSMLLPMLERLVWSKKVAARNLIAAIMLSLLFISMPLSFVVSDFYSSLQVDTLVAFIFVYCLYLVCTESKHFSRAGLLRLSVALTFLCLVKQTAILFALIAAMIYLSNLFITYQTKLNLKNKLKRLAIDTKEYFKHWRKHWQILLVIFAAILLPVVCNKLWSAQIVNYRSPDPGVAIFHIEANDVLKIPDILLGNTGSPAQKSFARGFIKHLIYDPSGLALNNMGIISFLQFLIICLGCIVIIGLASKDKVQRRKYTALTIWLFIGWALYCLALYCVFLFGGMKDCEMNDLAVTSRYIRTYLFALFLLVNFIVLNKIINGFTQGRAQKAMAIFVTIIIVFFGIFFNPQTSRDLGIGTNQRNKTELMSYNISKITELLTDINKKSNSTVNNPTKVLVTSDADYTRHYIQYKATPSRVTLLFKKQIKSEDPNICDILKKYDYLVTNSAIDGTWSLLNKCLAPHNMKISNYTAYKIQTNNDGTQLLKIY